VADGVNTAVKGVEMSAIDEARELAAGEPKLPELPPRHHAMLPLRQRGQPCPPTWMSFCSCGRLKVIHVGHRPNVTEISLPVGHAVQQLCASHGERKHGAEDREAAAHTRAGGGRLALVRRDGGHRELLGREDVVRRLDPGRILGQCDGAVGELGVRAGHGERLGCEDVVRRLLGWGV
jgi:hypothetical protein